MKYQEFRNFRAFSVYHKAEDVWTSDFCEPYEWGSEEEMRLDMLINYHADYEEDLQMFKQWDCQDEDEFIEMYNEYKVKLSTEW